MELLPDLPEPAFVQMGDFCGFALDHAARVGMRGATIVGMIGKLSKMADGRTMTHAAGSEVNTALLAEVARGVGADDALCATVATATPAATCRSWSPPPACPGSSTPSASACPSCSPRTPRARSPSTSSSSTHRTRARKVRPMNDMRQMTALGRAIEDDSFSIIDREVGPHDHDRAEWEVVRRIIHATTDTSSSDGPRASGTTPWRAGARRCVEARRSSWT